MFRINNFRKTRKQNVSACIVAVAMNVQRKCDQRGRAGNLQLWPADHVSQYDQFYDHTFHRNIVWSLVENGVVVFLTAAVFLGAYILKTSPIEHVNRPLSADEKYRFKRRGVQVYTFWFMMGILFWYLQKKTFLAGILSAFIMVLIYMFIKEGGESREEKGT